MSQSITVKSLGFESLTKSVPSTIDEYNALDPKRENAALEDAIDNTMKHSVLSKFRDKFLSAVEKTSGVARINHGTEDEPQWESDAKFLKRVIVSDITKSGGSPTDPTAVAAWYLSNAMLAQTTLDSVVFAVASTRTGGTAPQKVGKQDLATAQEAIDSGKADKFAALLSKALNRTVGTTQEELATAIKDRRAALVAQAAEAQKAELAALDS